MKQELGHGLGNRASIRTIDGIVEGSVRCSEGLNTPGKWHESAPSMTNVLAVVRARPAMWPTAC